MTTAENQKIINYYNSTEFDYWFGLGLNFHNGLHFGYWDERTKSQFDAIRNLNRVLAQKAGMQAGDRILDAGCGVGGSSVWLAKHYDVDVTGINISQAQVDKATKRANKQRLAKVKFQNENFCKTTFSDKSFDVVWAIESVSHAFDKAAFIREASRLLVGGGRIVVADGFLAERQLSPVERENMQIWLDGWAVPNLAKVSEFTDLLERNGFEDIVYEESTTQVIKFSKWLHDRSKLFYGAGELLRRVGIRDEIAQNNMRAAMWQYDCLKQGLWRYGIFSARKK